MAGRTRFCVAWTRCADRRIDLGTEFGKSAATGGMKHWKDEIRMEWTQRSLRQGVSKVMSVRYPDSSLDEEAIKYTQAAAEFMSADLDGMDVLEIGCGIGLLTERLIVTAAKVTCVEAISEMIVETRRRLGNRADAVRFVHAFAQDYGSRQHDIVVCARVLVHNTSAESFQSLVRLISSCANTLFVFEPIDSTFKPDSASIARDEQQIVAAFRGYSVARRKEYQLSVDKYVFLKLMRSEVPNRV